MLFKTNRQDSVRFLLSQLSSITLIKIYLEHYQIPIMDYFIKMVVNGFQLLTILVKNSIIDV